MWDHMQLVNAELSECVWFTVIAKKNFTFINFNAAIRIIYSVYG